MPKFVKFLQLVVFAVIVGFIGYDLVLHGIAVFQEKYVTISIALAALLELALYVIYKLIEDD